MPIFFWISVVVSIIVGVICAFKSDAIAGFIIGGATLVILLIAYLFIAVGMEINIQTKYADSKQWEVISEEELLPLTDDEQVFLIVEHEQNSTNEKYLYQAYQWEGAQCLDNTEDVVEIIYADFVTPAVVTESMTVNTWWVKLFLGETKIYRYTFVLADYNILNLQTY
jgi:hypothetical protein